MTALEKSERYWLGRFSASIGEAVKTLEEDPKWTRKFLRETLAAYIVSGLPAEERREHLRTYLK